MGEALIRLMTTPTVQVTHSDDTLPWLASNSCATKHLFRQETLDRGSLQDVYGMETTCQDVNLSASLLQDSGMESTWGRLYVQNWIVHKRL